MASGQTDIQSPGPVSFQGIDLHRVITKDPQLAATCRLNVSGVLFMYEPYVIDVAADNAFVKELLKEAAARLPGMRTGDENRLSITLLRSSDKTLFLESTIIPGDAEADHRSGQRGPGIFNDAEPVISHAHSS